MYKKTENSIIINGKKKCIYCKAKSRAQYVRHDKKYMTVKEYKQLLKKKDTNRMNKKKSRKMRGGNTPDEIRNKLEEVLETIESFNYEEVQNMLKKNVVTNDTELNQSLSKINKENFLSEIFEFLQNNIKEMQEMQKMQEMQEMQEM